MNATAQLAEILQQPCHLFMRIKKSSTTHQALTDLVAAGKSFTKQHSDNSKNASIP